MKKRQFLKLALAATASGFQTGAFAAGAEARTSNKLPFRQVSVKADGEKAVFFFDFSCQFSANYHIPMLNWERTLPKGPNVPAVSVEYVPVINYNDQRRRNDMAIGAAGYYAALATCRDQTQFRSFLEAVYDGRLRDGHPLTSRTLWTFACKKAGLDFVAFSQNAAKVHKDVLAKAALRLTQYQVATTPTVGVAGQFILTPDDVNGDAEMFFNILNGLASNYLLV